MSNYNNCFDNKKTGIFDKFVIILSMILILCKLYRLFLVDLLNNSMINLVVFWINIISIITLIILFIIAIIKMTIWIYRNNKKDGFECTEEEMKNYSEKD